MLNASLETLDKFNNVQRYSRDGIGIIENMTMIAKMKCIGLVYQDMGESRLVFLGKTL